MRIGLMATVVLLACSVVSAQDKKPTPPPVKVSSTKNADGTYNITASCPKGWKVYIPQADMDAYNNGPRDPDDMINLLSQAVCVIRKEVKR